MLNDRSSILSLLKTRRSGRPRDLAEPGPSEAQLHEILSIASRVPDHGKLAPWRFVIVRKEDRGAFEQLLHRAYRVDHPEPGRLEIEASQRFAHQAPALIVAASITRERCWMLRLLSSIWSNLASIMPLTLRARLPLPAKC